MSNTKKVLILGGRNYSNKRILQELRLLGIKAAITPTKNYTLFTSNSSGGDNIYYKDDRIYYSSVDAIIPRIGRNFNYGVSLVRHMNKNNGCFTTSDSEGLINASDKQKCTQILSKARIQVPATAYFQKVNNYKFITDLVGGLPCVAKLVSGSQGKGVFILTDELSGSTALKTILLSQKVLIQEYLESSKKDENKSDIRAWVVGDKVVAAMKRYSVDKDFRSNYSISKNAEPITLTEEEKEMAVKSAQAVGLKLCGVDLIRDVSSKKTYVIECNGNASLAGIEKVTKINVAKHIATYVKNNAVNRLDTTTKLSQTRELLKNLQNKIHDQFAIDKVDTHFGTKFLSPFDEPIEVSTDEENMEMGRGKNGVPEYIEMSMELTDKIGYPRNNPSNALSSAKNWIKENSL